jgi:hypothetical protein
MAKALRRQWTARFLAATLSLALSFALVFGTAVHARDHAHHHGDAARHASHHHHHHHVANQPGEEAVTAAHEDGGVLAANAGADEPDHKTLHHNCLDFICHGGIAILANGDGWQAPWWPEGRPRIWQSDHVVSVSPARLERPPKAFASA